MSFQDTNGDGIEDTRRNLRKTTAAKAQVGAVATGVVAGLTAFVTAYADQVIDGAEWATIAIAVIVGAGLTGGAVYATTNKPKA